MVEPELINVSPSHTAACHYWDDVVPEPGSKGNGQ